jgi:hypothetical protein
MAYIINKFSGVQLVVLEDGTIDTSTSLGLVGRNYVGYGETQNENFVYLLENFANDAPPSRPLQGQIWFDTTTNLANVYDGSRWTVIGAAILNDLPPTDPNAGALWLKTPVNTLNVWTGTEWRFIGPEAVPGFGTTRARAGTLEDSDGNPRAVVFLDIDNQTTAICTNAAFTVDAASGVPGFSNSLVSGINLRSTSQIQGNITGRAGTADRLTTGRFINNVTFDGQSDITIKSSTTNKLKKGGYITGSDFDGSAETTWDIDATSANIIGKVVARNSSGGFAAGTITADLVGNVTGNVTASSGTSSFNVVQANTFVGATLTGTANAARQLALSPKINGTTFTGLQDITVTAESNTLTGNQLAANVVNSSLTSVGNLISLSINDTGATIGSFGQFRLLVDSTVPTIRSTTGTLNFDIGPSGPDISFVNGATSLSLGGPNAPAIVGDNTTNLGITGYKFNGIYANNLYGNADTATLATRATNIVGGGAGAIPYQTAANTTTMLGLGADGYVLRARPSGPQWEALAGLESLTKGTHVNFVNTATSATLSTFNGTAGVTVSVDAVSTNTANKIVARDSSGNFAAGTITANLTGNVTGNASTATKLVTARTINGVNFDGTANITITAPDTTKVAKSGDSMSGYLTLNANPVSPLHATPKQYVDSRLPVYTFTSGNTEYAYGYTNQVGSWNNTYNWVDVFPPSGKTMGNLAAFIPSIAVIHYAGGVNGDDSMRCTWANLGDRIRIWVQNTEQRSTPAANWLAIWS